jgi:hypothetical protein
VSRPADEPELCPACGYDLTGLPGEVCPECGRRTGSAERPWEIGRYSVGALTAGAVIPPFLAALGVRVFLEVVDVWGVSRPLAFFGGLAVVHACLLWYLAGIDSPKGAMERRIGFVSVAGAVYVLGALSIVQGWP